MPSGVSLFFWKYNNIFSILKKIFNFKTLTFNINFCVIHLALSISRLYFFDFKKQKYEFIFPSLCDISTKFLNSETALAVIKSNLL